MPQTAWTQPTFCHLPPSSVTPARDNMDRHHRVFLSAALLFGILFPCPSPLSFTSPLTLFHWLTHSHPSDLIFSDRHLL